MHKFVIGFLCALGLLSTMHAEADERPPDLLARVSALEKQLKDVRAKADQTARELQFVYDLAGHLANEGNWWRGMAGTKKLYMKYTRLEFCLWTHGTTNCHGPGADLHPGRLEVMPLWNDTSKRVIWDNQ